MPRSAGLWDKRRRHRPPIPAIRLIISRGQNAAEITYSGAPPDSGDITSIQFFAVNSTIQVLSGTKVLQTAGFTVPASTLYNEIAALSSTPNVDVIKSTKGANIGQIVRVLAPNQFRRGRKIPREPAIFPSADFLPSRLTRNRFTRPGR